MASSAAGHVLGLGLSRAPADRVASTLRERCGIVSNRVGDAWTGVSLARYKRLVELIARDSRSTHYPALPLFLRTVWERAETKRGLLDFFLALDEHTGCLEPKWRSAFTCDSDAADAWCAGAFAPTQTDEAAVEAAARRVLLPQRAPTLPRDGPSFARALEVLAANLCEVQNI